MKNIIIYKNYIHHIGEEWRTPVKKDAVGISVDVNVENVWIIDNLFHDIGGDAIQVASDSGDVGETYILYIGKNTGFHFYEKFWTLKCVAIL